MIRSSGLTADSNVAAETTSADDAIARFNKLGLRVVGVGDGKQRQFFADFEKSFKPLDEPLPLEELSGRDKSRSTIGWI